jgi:predicted nucleic acid-binding protein
LIFVDTNVISDVLGRDPIWCDWSLEQLSHLAHHGPLFSNMIVVAELHERAAFVPHIKDFFDALSILLLDMHWACAARAGEAHRLYRRRGGTAPKIVADLLIGAHASLDGVGLLTRDAKGFRSYFPELHLITPETDHG